LTRRPISPKPPFKSVISLVNREFETKNTNNENFATGFRIFTAEKKEKKKKWRNSERKNKDLKRKREILATARKAKRSENGRVGN